MSYANVYVDLGRRSLDRPFTYAVPRRLSRQAQPGSRVLVPFRRRRVVGWVVERLRRTEVDGVKEIEAVLDPADAIEPHLMALARWVADYYCCPLPDSLRLVLPPAGTKPVARVIRAAPGVDAERLAGRPMCARLYDLVVHSSEGIGLEALRRRAAAAGIPRDGVAAAVEWLRRRGFIEESAEVRSPAVGPKVAQVVALGWPREQAETLLIELAEKPRSRGRAAVLRAVLEGLEGLSAVALARAAGASPTAVASLIAAGVLRREQRSVGRSPWDPDTEEPAAPVRLTREQATALDHLLDAVREGRPEVLLLHGVTASGKTEVFLQAIEAALASGRQAIALVPEISLTAQAMTIFRGRFGDRIALLHSALSPGERYDEWQRVRDGRAQVVLGARSAVFAPSRDPGLIVIDEEHEPSYKQEHAPRYHAREVAIKRAELAGCPVLLASATPSLESYHAASTGRYHLLSLPERIEGRPLPAVNVVDLRRWQTPRGLFSPQLCQAMIERVERGEQTILFLNRRGFATFMLCTLCGHSFRCPQCEVALSFHRRERRLRCHHCDYSEAVPTTCPKCGGAALRHKGRGTERVEDELARVCPKARASRLDRDTTARKGAHVRIFRDFRDARSDILVGTQMVAKGFDFPGVTLVGVISADTALNFPDFRAAERTFQLLTQVAGRAGRREVPGEVLVQTYDPDHYSVRAAADHDYQTFYDNEIESRREVGYPPFRRLAHVVASSPEEERAERAISEFKEACRAVLEEHGLEVEIVGPAAAPLARLKGRYRWHLLLRSPEHDQIRQAVAGTREHFREPRQVTLTIDIDPVSLL